MCRLSFILFLFIFAQAVNAKDKIQHRFVASDESGHQVIYVDEANPSKNWAVPVNCRDMQLIGKNELLVNNSQGYTVLSLKDGSTKKTFKSELFHSVNSVRRLKNGDTYLTGKGKAHPVIIQILDKDDREKKVISVDSSIKDVRLMRVTMAKTFFMGFGDKIYELDGEGKIVWQQQIAGGRHIYKAVRTKRGKTYVASGYGSSVHLLDKEGNLLMEYGKADGQQVKNPQFFADFQILRNGHVVVCNWMGHGRKDSEKGQQLAQYDRKGQLVWSWQDAEMAGCLHAVIVLDGLNTKKLHTEERGLLAPAR